MKIILARLTVLIAGFLLLISIGTCGIPSYPYLYPPEALDGGRVGFSHDSDNDPTVFAGYEFFYRFYSTDPGTVGGSGQAVQDIQSYFTSSFQISSVVYEDESSAFSYGFRRAYVEPGGDAQPQLSIKASDINTTFNIELLDDNSINEVKFSYDSSLYFLKRSVTDTNDDYKSFLPLNDSDVYDFNVGEEDIIDDDVDSDNIFVAFYAVPYGIDPETLATLYANGNYEGMEYIGSFQLY